MDWLTPCLVITFVLSGASGLIYQLSWIRLLSLTFGVTIYAVSTVVASFMGGLALGSYLGGLLADRARRPILWYAVAEVFIAFLGLSSIGLLSWVRSSYLMLYPVEADQPALALTLLRFLLTGAVLLAPTTLMGATLPLMVKGSLAMGRGLGIRVSWLYAGNTAGAIAGTVAAGFVLIGTFGTSAAIGLAALLNLAASAPAFLLGLIARPVSQGASPDGPAARRLEPARNQERSMSPLREAHTVTRYPAPFDDR